MGLGMRPGAAGWRPGGHGWVPNLVTHLHISTSIHICVYTYIHIATYRHTCKYTYAYKHVDTDVYA